MHGGGAKKGGSGSDKVINDEPSKRGGAIGGKKGGKASGELPASILAVARQCTIISLFLITVTSEAMLPQENGIVHI